MELSLKAKKIIFVGALLALFAWTLVLAVAILSGYDRDDEWLKYFSWATLGVATIVTLLIGWSGIPKDMSIGGSGGSTVSGY